MIYLIRHASKASQIPEFFHQITASELPLPQPVLAQVRPVERALASPAQLAWVRQALEQPVPERNLVLEKQELGQLAVPEVLPARWEALELREEQALEAFASLGQEASPLRFF